MSTSLVTGLLTDLRGALLHQNALTLSRVAHQFLSHQSSRPMYIQVVSPATRNTQLNQAFSTLSNNRETRFMHFPRLRVRCGKYVWYFHSKLISTLGPTLNLLVYRGFFFFSLTCFLFQHCYHAGKRLVREPYSRLKSSGLSC